MSFFQLTYNLHLFNASFQYSLHEVSIQVRCGQDLIHTLKPDILFHEQ